MPSPVAAGLAAYSRHVSGAKARFSHIPLSAAGRACVPPKPTEDMLSTVSAAAWASSRLPISAVGS